MVLASFIALLALDLGRARRSVPYRVCKLSPEIYKEKMGGKKPIIAGIEGFRRSDQQF